MNDPHPHYRRAITFRRVTCQPTNLVDALAEERGILGQPMASSYGRPLNPSGPRRGAALGETWEWGLVDAPREARYGTKHMANIVQTPEGPVVDLYPYPDLEAFNDLGEVAESVVVLDVETTGLNPLLGDRIVSVAAVVVEADARSWRMDPRARRVFTVNPGRESSPEALAVHKLDATALAGRPGFDACAWDLRRFLSGKGWYENEKLHQSPVIIAHNAPFDLAFLNVELADCGQPRLDNACIDTRALSRRLWPDAPSSLDALCDRLGVERGSRDEGRTALGDVSLLAACLPGLHAVIERYLDGNDDPDA